MVKDIRFKFMPYYDDMDAEDYHNFDLWGKLDILIDGVSFFNNYNYTEIYLIRKKFPKPIKIL